MTGHKQRMQKGVSVFSYADFTLLRTLCPTPINCPHVFQKDYTQNETKWQKNGSWKMAATWYKLTHDWRFHFTIGQKQRQRHTTTDFVAARRTDSMLKTHQGRLQKCCDAGTAQRPSAKACCKSATANGDDWERTWNRFRCVCVWTIN